MKPPAKIQIPQEEEQDEEQDEEEPRAGGGEHGGWAGPALWVCTGSHLFLLLLASAIPSSSPYSEEATGTRGGQSRTRG